ncbi:MAG: hypothetical protein K2X48_08290 [Chitinophagaceae bacterium]|nr:hypothetical protein [Chitinophagaceae bacterium]
MMNNKNIEFNINILLSKESNPSQLRQAAIDLKNLLTEMSEMDENKPGVMLTLDTPSGRATGTYGAAMCTIDYMRTRRFMQGVVSAVTELLKTHSSVKLLYAGCGPFALLVLPLTLLFTPAQVQIQCIELNTTSIGCFQKLISKLNVKAFFKEVICDDAAEIKLQQADAYDMMITETMMHALKNEAQVAIIINLMNQCRKDIVLIPHEVQVQFACIAHDSSLLNKVFRSQLPLLHLNKQTAQEFSNWLQHRNDVLLQKTIDLSNDVYHEGDKLSYLTTIHVYGRYSLFINESGLTVPVAIQPLQKINPGQSIQFQYRMGSKPGFVYEFI